MNIQTEKEKANVNTLTNDCKEETTKTIHFDLVFSIFHDVCLVGGQVAQTTCAWKSNIETVHTEKDRWESTSNNKRLKLSEVVTKPRSTRVPLPQRQEGKQSSSYATHHHPPLLLNILLSIVIIFLLLHCLCFICTFFHLHHYWGSPCLVGSHTKFSKL